METVYADELYQFLSESAGSAKCSGNKDLLERIDFAMKHYLFPLTSEFLGVSMVVLREVLDQQRGILTPKQAEQADAYVDRIKKQFFSA